MGHDFSYATPVGYEPDELIIKRASNIAEKTGARIISSNDPEKVAQNAGVIYTDIFLYQWAKSI